MIRHGDILLKPVAPPRERPTALGTRPEIVSKSEPGERLTLATGEATGHAHVLHGLAVTAVALMPPGRGQDTRALVQVLEPAALRHEEHREIIIPPGWTVRD